MRICKKMTKNGIILPIEIHNIFFGLIFKHKIRFKNQIFRFRNFFYKKALTKCVKMSIMVAEKRTHRGIMSEDDYGNCEKKDRNDTERQR